MPWEHKYSDDELLAACRRLADESGGLLTLQGFCAAVGVSPSTIHQRFGGWLKFRERAGLKGVRSFVPAATEGRRRELIDQLRAAAIDVGWEINIAEFCGRVRVSNATIQRLFGSWRNLRKAAGLPARRRVTAQHLLLELSRLVRKLGHFPTTTAELDRLSRYGWRVYARFFQTLEHLQVIFEREQSRRRAKLRGDAHSSSAMRESSQSSNSAGSSPAGC